jgi:predicted ATPase
LGIATQEINDPAEIERQVLRQLNQRRTLIVLDNTETLIEAVRAGNGGVTQLSQLIQQLAGPTVSLLVTSREHLGWSGEVAHEIGGLSSEEGAYLFRQSAPQRANEVEMALAKELSQKLNGHPLSLRLLGGAFNAGSITLKTFLEDCDEQLLKAENKYVGTEHRHRTLYACIDTSVRYLDAELTDLFSKLWLFHTPFLPETAVAIFDPQADDTEDKRSPIYDRLYTLWRRGLLVREEVTMREATIQFYRVLPTIHPYIEKYLAQPDERKQLLARFGAAYAALTRYLYDELDRGGVAAFIAFQSCEDLERGGNMCNRSGARLLPTPLGMGPATVGRYQARTEAD